VKKNSISLMSHISHIVKTTIFTTALLLYCSSAIYAGVGAPIEGKEQVDVFALVKFTAIFLAGIGAVFGIGLAFAAKKFAVQIDPRVEQILDILPHAHCGACGYAGCQQYAEAVILNADIPPNLCSPGGVTTAKIIASITGKEMKEIEPKIARIFCQGGLSKSLRRFKYEGVEDCRAAILAGGGDKTCIYGCLGYGTCAKVCPFDAIIISDDYLPIVDPIKCTACGKCAQACPTKVIEILPLAKEVLVRCHSKDKGADTRKNCQIGCIACGICVKVCPYNAMEIENNLARINLDKCKVCGLCVPKCPTKAIMDYIPQRPKAFVTEKCIGCGICTKVCPVNAVSGELKKLHIIEPNKCIGCGICTAKCPMLAITGTFNYVEVAEIVAAKKAAKVKETEVSTTM